MGTVRRSRDIFFIVVHHSGLGVKTLEDIDRLHRRYRKFTNGCGYDYVIEKSGVVRQSKRWEKKLQGAHCRVDGDNYNTWNKHSIGVCLIGDFRKSKPNKSQTNSLAVLLRKLMGEFSIPIRLVLGHKEIDITACPGTHLQKYIELMRKET